MVSGHQHSLVSSVVPLFLVRAFSHFPAGPSELGTWPHSCVTATGKLTTLPGLRLEKRIELEGP